MDRKKNILDYKKISNEVIERVTSVFDVDEIVLFGSFAKGCPNEYSDVDIAIVSPEINPSEIMCKNVKEIKDKSDLLLPGLQLFAFHSKTFYSEDYINPNFIKEIKKTGKVLYSKPKK